MDRKHFDRIKQRHGSYASWAVWAESSGKPKSSIDDISVLDADANPALLPTLRNDVVMVGLNIARPFSEPFRNFHDPSPRANDFKIRYAFTYTPYYGAYMTDMIKGFEEPKSTEVLKRLKAGLIDVKKHVEGFLQELADLQFVKPTILAFGAAACGLVADNIPDNAYSRLIKLTHYSHRIRKEEYRQVVLRQIGIEPA